MRAVGGLAALAAATLVLMAAAFYNGFPLIYADTGGYLARPFEHTLQIGRSALYGGCLAAGMAADFWPEIAAQALATAWIIALTLRTHGAARWRGATVAAAVAMALATSLPWYVSQLIPDIFVSLSALALYLLAFRRDALARAETFGLAALIAFGIASHMAVLALCLALGLAGLALWPLLAPERRPAIMLPCGALAAGLALALASNFAIAGKLAFTPGGANFVFGRLLQDGIVARYLADRCPDTTIALCAYRDALPTTADDWMWGWGSPYYKLGGAEAFAPEARRIAVESLTMYPRAHLTTALRAALTQFVMFKGGEGMHSHDNEHAVAALRHYAPPPLVARFNAARQQHDALHAERLNALQVPFGWAMIAALPLIMGLAWRGLVSAHLGTLAAAMLLVLALNAAISGIFSNPNDRYQSRMLWLAALVVITATTQSRPAARKPA